MKPYEELSEEEAKTRKIEAERIIKEKEEAEANRIKEEREAEAKRLEEEAAVKLAEEKRGYESGITYDNLARNPDEYIGSKVKFSGKIIQVIEGDNFTQYRMTVNNDYDRIMLLEIDKSIIKNDRILENDNIVIYGISVGIITYDSTFGGKITVPAVLVDSFERK